MRKGIPPKAGSCAGGRSTGLAFETRPNPPDKPPNPPKRILKIIRNEICSLKHRRRMCPNDYLKALQLGKKYTGSSKFLMLHNQTGGGLMDIVELSLDKISGATDVSRQVAEVLSKVSPNSTIYAHSQGIIMVRNAINLAARKGLDISSFTVHFDGAAVNQYGTNVNFEALGAKSLASFNTHSVDAVPNIIGYNAFTTPNPFRIIGSVVASPLLGVGGEWSPHTYRNGGKYFRWIPDFY